MRDKDNKIRLQTGKTNIVRLPLAYYLLKPRVDIKCLWDKNKLDAISKFL